MIEQSFAPFEYDRKWIPWTVQGGILDVPNIEVYQDPYLDSATYIESREQHTEQHTIRIDRRGHCTLDYEYRRNRK